MRMKLGRKMPRTEVALSGMTIEELVKNLLNNEGDSLLEDSEKEKSTSCAVWGPALQNLFAGNNFTTIYNGQLGRKVQSHHWIEVQQALLNGEMVFVQVYGLPDTENHVFTIVGYGNGSAYILHAWQGKHRLRSESPMTVRSMLSCLRKLQKYGYPNKAAKARTVRKKLWGEDHMGPDKIQASRKPYYNLIQRGTPNNVFYQNKRSLERIVLRLAKSKSRASRSAEADETLSEEEALVTPKDEREIASEASSDNTSMLFDTAFGLVLGASNTLYLGEEDTDEVGLIAHVRRDFRAAIEGSVLHSSIMVGAAMFGVIAIWDVAQWAKHNITGVQLRKKLVQSAGCVVGGVTAAMAAGAAGGTLFGEIGAATGRIIGGIIGIIAGEYAGKALIEKIWDESEDSVMNAYEFFGWHNVHRHTRPIKSAKEIRKAYEKMLEKNKLSPKFTDEEWSTICTATLMVLLRAMFPEFKEMLGIAKKLFHAKSHGVLVVGNTMYNQLALPHHSAQRHRYSRCVLL